VLAIRVDDVKKRFGSVEAVAGVSFEVERGETFGILGPNGAGKTTTLEMIEGLTRPDQGTIELLGEPVWPSPEHVQRRIGVQLQSTALFDYLTTGELLELFCRFYGPVPQGAVDRALATVGLEEKKHERVNKLSGGQQQRAAIALALVHQPQVVFLDEPTTGLDPQARRNLWDVISAIGAEGRTVVLTTHYLEEAETLCNRVAIMDDARIVALDSPDGLVRSFGGAARIHFLTDGLSLEAVRALPAVEEAATHDGVFEVVSTDPQPSLIALLGTAERAGAELQELTVQRPSLDDVFLAVTGREFRE
jgi:ABC-2 type transport system ATP-binding protein